MRASAHDNRGLQFSSDDVAALVRLYASPVTAPALASPTSSGVTATTATLGGTISSEGGAAITGRGVVYAPTSVNSNPSIGGTGVTQAPSSGTAAVFTADATGLLAGTSHSFKAYATNSAGTGYSSVATFTTGAPTVPAAPTMGTATAGNTTVIVAFTPGSNGGSPVTGYTATCGAMSAFASASPITVTGLTNGIPVTCTAFATNAVGNSAPSAASNSVTPTTVPMVASPTSTGVTATAATLGGTVTSEAGFAITERGIVYSLTATNSNPLVGGSGVTKSVVSGTGTGILTSGVSGLQVSSGYSFRAYATNSVGTGYSTAGTFTTLAGTTIPRLVNISTRGVVALGDNIMIGGFVVGGTAPKKVVITGRGPVLTDFSVPDALIDPAIRLFEGPTEKAFNDNWQSAPNAAEITASGFAPTKASEAAILTTVQPNVPYTVHVTGVGPSNIGVALVEVFEADHPEFPVLNISTRGNVLSGDQVLIGGFIIQGNSPQQVLVTAKGPSLGQAPFNVPGALPDPTLELYQAGVALPIETNDDWGTSPNAAAIQATGIPPTSPLESAIIRTLAPGAYTAIVRGKNGQIGIGLVEVYAK